jgi:hypothetical protein
LLDRQPEEMVWPRTALPPFFDPRQQRLLVNCDSLGLLRLGDTPAAGYKIQVAIAQTRWVGGIGIFFGAREERDGKNTILRYQRIELLHFAPPRKAGAPDTFSLARTKGVRSKSPDGEPQSNDLELCQNLLPPLTGPAYFLEIQVSSRGGLRAVRWGGEDLKELVTHQANGVFAPRDYVGGFGLYISKGTGVFTDARIMILEKDEP